jgi:hypothetical protein
MYMDVNLEFRNRLHSRGVTSSKPLLIWDVQTWGLIWIGKFGFGVCVGWTWTIKANHKNLTKITPEQAWRSRGWVDFYMYSFFNYDARWDWCQLPSPATLPVEKRPGTFVGEAGWALGPVSMGTENLALTRIWTPDRPNSSNTERAIASHTLNISTLLLIICYKWLIKYFVGPVAQSV